MPRFLSLAGCSHLRRLSPEISPPVRVPPVGMSTSSAAYQHAASGKSQLVRTLISSGSQCDDSNLPTQGVVDPFVDQCCSHFSCGYPFVSEVVQPSRPGLQRFPFPPEVVLNTGCCCTFPVQYPGGTSMFLICADGVVKVSQFNFWYLWLCIVEWVFSGFLEVSSLSDILHSGFDPIFFRTGL